MAHVTFVTFIFVNPSAPWHPEMKFLVRAVVVYRNGWVSASDLRLLKSHFNQEELYCSLALLRC
jgi:hypothetical protein